MTVDDGRRTRISREPIRVDRLRHIDGTFAFVPHRFLRDGFYASLTPDESALYLLLVLVGDRNGVSFYHYDSLCSLLQMDVDRYLAARDALIALDLLAFDGTRFQLLSLPREPARRPPPGRAQEHRGGAHIRDAIRDCLAGPSGRDPDER